jgi:hypothetical protein
MRPSFPTLARAYLRRRPEAWFIPAALLVALTSLTRLGQSDIGWAVFSRVTFATADPIIPFTLAFAFATSAAIVFILYRQHHLNAPRSLLVAIASVIGAVGVFEIPYQAIRGYVFPTLDGGWPSFGAWLALCAWVILGFTGVGFMRVSRPLAVLLGLIALGFLGWWAFGYPSASVPPGGNLAVAYAFNVPLKLGCFLIYPMAFWGRKEPISSE